MGCGGASPSWHACLHSAYIARDGLATLFVYAFWLALGSVLTALVLLALLVLVAQQQFYYYCMHMRMPYTTNTTVPV